MVGTMAAGRNVSSATIGGVSATIHASTTGNDQIRAAFSAIVPTGTTADIVINMSDSVFNDVRLAVYSVDDNDLEDGSSPNVGGTLGSSSDSVTVNYTAFAGGSTLLYGSWNNGNSAKTPVTTSPTFGEDYPNDSFNGAHRFFYLDGEPSSGATSVTVSWSGNYTSNFGVITWEPKAAPPAENFPEVISRTPDRVTTPTTDPVTITLPAHQAGDLIQIALSVNGNTNATATTGSTSGWTISKANNGTAVTGFIIRKIAESDSETLVLAFEAA
jgi:hypothetical protein